MVIIQKPNLLLIIALIGFAISYIPERSIHLVGRTAFTMAIIAWAYEEIAHGVNLFRKILGALVLAVVAVSLFQQLQ
jgi:hypothetical protein